MDHADDGDDDDDGVFVYMGGSIPRHLRETITHIRVHKSVNIIADGAFEYCNNLVSIEMHDGVEIIKEGALNGCTYLSGIKLTGVRIIEDFAFYDCKVLRDVEFGDKLESIGEFAFASTNLKKVQLPYVRVIGNNAFAACKYLTEVQFSKELETVGRDAFYNCRRLRRIAMPLKDAMFGIHAVFTECDDLSRVDLIGGIHQTISSLLLDTWRDEMNDEIDSFNQALPYNESYDKTAAIRHWVETVIRRLERFKSEHYALLKKNMTQLELALWKATLHEEEEEEREQQPTKKAKIDEKCEKASTEADAVDANLQNAESAFYLS
jgi:hypothetical protein